MPDIVNYPPKEMRNNSGRIVTAGYKKKGLDTSRWGQFEDSVFYDLRRKMERVFEERGERYENIYQWTSHNQTHKLFHVYFEFFKCKSCQRPILHETEMIDGVCLNCYKDKHNA